MHLDLVETAFVEDQLFQGFLVRMPPDRFSEIPVAVAVACNQFAETRQDVKGVKVVDLLQRFV